MSQRIYFLLCLFPLKLKQNWLKKNRSWDNRRKERKHEYQKKKIKNRKLASYVVKKEKSVKERHNLYVKNNYGTVSNDQKLDISPFLSKEEERLENYHRSSVLIVTSAPRKCCSEASPHYCFIQHHWTSYIFHSPWVLCSIIDTYIFTRLSHHLTDVPKKQLVIKSKIWRNFTIESGCSDHFEREIYFQRATQLLSTQSKESEVDEGRVGRQSVGIMLYSNAPLFLLAPAAHVGILCWIEDSWTLALVVKIGAGRTLVFKSERNLC